MKNQLTISFGSKIGLKKQQIFILQFSKTQNWKHKPLWKGRIWNSWPEEGTVMTVSFRINGQSFTALNGGPVLNLMKQSSFQIFCETQAELIITGTGFQMKARKVSVDGLKINLVFHGRFIPEILSELMSDPAIAVRVTKAFLQMKKFDIEVWCRHKQN